MYFGFFTNEYVGELLSKMSNSQEDRKNKSQTVYW